MSIKANPSPTLEQLEAFRFVADWCHSNNVVPPEVHDAAAFALDRSSLAHGFYTPSTEATNEQLTNDAFED